MRVLIADDHALVLDMMSMLLSSEAEIEVSTAQNLEGVVEKVQSGERFDLILLDFNMPGMSGLSGMRKTIELAAGTPVALMSGVATRAVAQEALDEGAAGFIPKTLSARSLINATRFMASGEKFAPVEFLTSDDEGAGASADQKLSQREMQVLGGLCRGLSNKEIGLELSIQEVTIKLHVKTLCGKLGARNRTQAAMIARDTGLY
ncbi:MAG: response regulator transcription factor [Lentilitoribacter sp.]